VLAQPTIRVSDYAARAARRWYIILAAVVVALLIAGIDALTTHHDRVEASALVYTGQPSESAGSSPLQNPVVSAPGAVSRLVGSQPAITQAATAAHVAPASLQGRVTAQQVLTTATPTGSVATIGTPFYTINVHGPWQPRQAATIANTLARTVRDAANRYTAAQVTTLRTQIAAQTASIQTINHNQHQAQTLADRLEGTPAHRRSIGQRRCAGSENAPLRRHAGAADRRLVGEQFSWDGQGGRPAEQPPQRLPVTAVRSRAARRGPAAAQPTFPSPRLPR
jgi:capsular polysaccharide biosynthesis protein